MSDHHQGPRMKRVKQTHDNIEIDTGSNKIIQDPALYTEEGDDHRGSDETITPRTRSMSHKAEDRPGIKTETDDLSPPQNDSKQSRSVSPAASESSTATKILRNCRKRRSEEQKAQQPAHSCLVNHMPGIHPDNPLLDDKIAGARKEELVELARFPSIARGLKFFKFIIDILPSIGSGHRLREETRLVSFVDEPASAIEVINDADQEVAPEWLKEFHSQKGLWSPLAHYNRELKLQRVKDLANGKKVLGTTEQVEEHKLDCHTTSEKCKVLNMRLQDQDELQLEAAIFIEFLRRCYREWSL